MMEIENQDISVGIDSLTGHPPISPWKHTGGYFERTLAQDDRGYLERFNSLRIEEPNNTSRSAREQFDVTIHSLFSAFVFSAAA